MCLPVNPYRVEREWKAFGLSCAVVQGREAGNRCGYVRVPPGHPLYGRDYGDPDVDVHGGLTFADIEPCTEHDDGQGWWFGFDCGHAGDARYDPDADINTVGSTTRKMMEINLELDVKYPMPFGYEHFWTEGEVANETEHLAEQLALVSGPKLDKLHPFPISH